MEDQILTVQMDSTELQVLREQANIDIQVSTAKAFRRDEVAAINKSISIATMNEEMAQKCNYSVPRAGKAITGPSVHLARIMFQNYGNMRGESKVISIEGKEVVSEAYVWDLESNNALKTTVRRSIMTKSGRMSDDMITVTGNAANAIAFRNAFFGVVPQYAIEAVYEASKTKILGAADDFKKKLKAVFKAFKDKYKKEEADVLEVIGKTAMSQVTKEDLITLVGIGTSLKDGETTIEMVFKVKADPAKDVADKKAEMKDNKAQADKMP